MDIRKRNNSNEDVFNGFVVSMAVVAMLALGVVLGTMQHNSPTEVLSTSMSSWQETANGNLLLNNMTVNDPQQLQVRALRMQSSLFSSSASSSTASDFAQSPTLMLQNFQRAKDAFIAKLAQDYGTDYYGRIFYNKDHVSRGRTTLGSPSDKSRERLVRKILQKLLKARIVGTNYAYDTNFVWSTGGHSSAAGHGNFFETESYTAVMEAGAKPIFQQVGLDFTGRNYAMGGTNSYPELANCLAEIYGLDTDVLSWDYGMTDGSRDPSGFGMYCGRAAGILPRFPACIGLQISNKMIDMFTEQETEHGMSIFYWKDTEQDALVNAVPDTFGLSTEQIENMPKYVKSLRCGNAFEHGDPNCGEEKWNMTYCPDRKFKTSWHPGWKSHALTGNILALFMIDLLEDALLELKNNLDSNDGAANWLQRLQILDAEDHQVWLGAEYKNHAYDFAKGIADDIDHKMLMKSPAFCHTGRLPAEIRHKGILTETTTKVGFYTFEEAIYKKDADAIVDKSSSLMRLVKDDDSRQSCTDVILQMDYKDNFYINYNDGPKKLILPNDMEKAYYGTNEPLKGYVAFCMALCDWGQCPESHLSENDMIKGEASMTVNGVAVTNVTEYGRCRFVKHDNGHRFPVNKEGRMEIVAQVLVEKKNLRFGSFVVW